MCMKKTYLIPHSKVLDFRTYHETMVQGDPRGSYVVNELVPEEPTIIGEDDAPIKKSLWDFEE